MERKRSKLARRAHNPEAWVNLFSQATAAEGKAVGIRVFAIAPGAVETQMMRSIFPDFPKDQTLDPDASRHLACLRHVGLVNDRRNGVWMYYSLARPSGVTHRRISEWLAEAATEVPQAAADLKALHAVHEHAHRCGRCANGNGQRKPVLTEAERS